MRWREEDVQNVFLCGIYQVWLIPDHQCTLLLMTPTAQGAYALLKPTQYQNVRYLLKYPMANIFFAGEGLSFASGWIQGALESGLRAAFQFYIRNEGQWSKEEKH